MSWFEYGKTETDCLTHRDPLLGKAIARIGMIKRRTNPDVFSALTESIISQQISSKAADTVLLRLNEALSGNVTPESVLSLGENLQKCGISFRKVSYILGAARAAIGGAINFDTLGALPAEEIIASLTALKGVGRWTAEMLLIFSLSRKDVLSRGDYGINKGVRKLYGVDSVSKPLFDELAERYSPYASVASLYLWEIAAQK